jgi:hypothetical protein
VAASNIDGRIVASLKIEAATAQMNGGKATAAVADLQTCLAEARECTAKVEEAVANAFKMAKDAEAAH